jgi:AraC-like DNA-binding protein
VTAIDVSVNFLYFSIMATESFAVELLAAQKTLCGADWRWENLPGAVDYLNLWSVVDGKGTLTLRDEIYPVQGGDCFVLPMWNYCLGEHDPEHPLTVLWALYRYADLRGRPAEPALPRRYRRLSDPVFFNQLYVQAINAYTADGALHQHAASWMSAVLMALDEQDRQPQFAETTHPLYAQIQQIRAQLQADPGQQVTVARLAESCGYSPGHFTRLFERYIGQTPRDFITQTRMEMAKSLLYLSGYSISRVAEQLGYHDVCHFSRHFRERTGMSPSAFRRHRPNLRRGKS